MRHRMPKIDPAVLLLIALMGCQTEYLPKPRGYNRFDLPEHRYLPSTDTLPYTFQYSEYARVLKDSSWISDKHWVEVHYPQYNANVHLTYKTVGNRGSLKEYLDDTYLLTAKHQIKAYAIDESITRTPDGKTVVYAELEGEVPSQFQFFTTDSARHFLRGALYFNTQVNNDSLRPAIEYIKVDIVHMMNTLKWNN